MQKYGFVQNEIKPKVMFDASVQNDQKTARKMSNDIEKQFWKGYNINKLYHEELFMVRQKV